jgi:hypothetical protein
MMNKMMMMKLNVMIKAGCTPLFVGVIGGDIAH